MLTGPQRSSPHLLKRRSDAVVSRCGERSPSVTERRKLPSLVHLGRLSIVRDKTLLFVIGTFANGYRLLLTDSFPVRYARLSGARVEISRSGNILISLGQREVQVGQTSGR